MNYLSLFSGIEAATVAWHKLGWECAGVAEIEKYPSKLLKAKYPNVHNFGDITKITEVDIALLGHVDIVVFGSPCQDLSVAGKRAGLAGERSGLFHDAMRIVGWLRKHCKLRFALWENVPGAFTSNGGADFAVVVGELAGYNAPVPPKGWGNEGALVGEEAMVEWSTLDAQWFGVAQRRRRVFALADFGDWAGRPPILLEPEGMRRDSAPRRGTGQDVAGTLEASAGRSRGAGTASGLLVASTGDVAHCLNADGMGRIDYETETMVIQPFVKATNPHSADEAPRYEAADVAHTLNGWDERHDPPKHMVVCATGDVTHTLKAEGFDASEDGTGRGTPIIAFNTNAQPDQMVFDPHVTAPLTVSQYAGVFTPQYGVRRLTPLECERLQAFPDNYTAIDGAADGPRYKALGNSMCTNVMWWIGFKIEVAVDEMWGTA